MSYPINYPTPQGANIQIFYAPGGPVNVGLSNQFNSSPTSWVKPQGASFVWFTLIGPGGTGDGTPAGGGSGAVTNCMMPAFLIPDELVVQVGCGQQSGVIASNTYIYYRGKGNTMYELLRANGGNLSGYGQASSSNYFSAAGFFQSMAGEPGVSGTVSPASYTFLSGGTTSGLITANYGYSSDTTSRGYFQFQPIIVGVGADATGSPPKKAGIGCGSGNNGGTGGDGLAVIISW
jgi:hypothetical protein